MRVKFETKENKKNCLSSEFYSLINHKDSINLTRNYDRSQFLAIFNSNHQLKKPNKLVSVWYFYMQFVVCQFIILFTSDEKPHTIHVFLWITIRV